MHGYIYFFFFFYFPAGVYVGTLNLITSIPDPSILTLYIFFLIFAPKRKSSVGTRLGEAVLTCTHNL